MTEKPSEIFITLCFWVALNKTIIASNNSREAVVKAITTAIW